MVKQLMIANCRVESWGLLRGKSWSGGIKSGRGWGCQIMENLLAVRD